MQTLTIYAAGWLGLVPLAILNGWVRETIYGPFMRERTAHQVSTIAGLVVFGLYIWIFTGRWAIASAGQAWLIGAMWLAMTIAFEFVFGHYGMGHSWARLLHDYHLLKGRIWLLVPVWTALAPYLFYRLRS